MVSFSEFSQALTLNIKGKLYKFLESKKLDRRGRKPTLGGSVLFGGWGWGRPEEGILGERGAERNLGTLQFRDNSSLKRLRVCP